MWKHHAHHATEMTVHQLLLPTYPHHVAWILHLWHSDPQSLIKFYLPLFPDTQTRWIGLLTLLGVSSPPLPPDSLPSVPNARCIHTRILHLSQLSRCLPCSLSPQGLFPCLNFSSVQYKCFETSRCDEKLVGGWVPWTGGIGEVQELKVAPGLLGKLLLSENVWYPTFPACRHVPSPLPWCFLAQSRSSVNKF